MKGLLVLPLSLLMVFKSGHCTTPAPAKKFTVDQYLNRYGYMAAYDGPPPEDKKEKAIREFQTYAHIPVTGVMDEATIAMLTGPRCGESDTSQTPPRLKRYIKHATKWRKLALSYSVHGTRLRPNSKISSTTVRATLEKSFRMWKDVSRLSFRRMKENDNNADIIVKFGSGSHGDLYPFDGTGGTLAHGFYPGSNTGIAGDIHFDDDEIWTINGEEGTTDYTWTTLHEIGHALGLRHSHEEDAVMWPWFTGYRANTKLTQDDINGIQSIYGKPTSPVKTTAKPKSKSSICNVQNFDAVLYQSNTRNTYFLKGSKVWEMNEKKIITKEELISTKWPGLESNLDSAYVRTDGDVIFFKGNRYWRYRRNSKVEGPRALAGYIKNHRKVNLYKIDSVLVWKGGSKNLVYFFTGTNFWRYVSTDKKIVKRKTYSPYPQTSSKSWRNIPFPVDSAMTWKNNRIYFFKDKNTYKYQYSKSSSRYNGKLQKKHFIKSCRG